MYLHSKGIFSVRVKQGLILAALTVFLNITGNSAFAESITLELLDGTVYTDVQVKRIQPTTLSFKYADGFATVPAGALTDESLSKLGLNPDDNPDFKAQREEMVMKQNLRNLKKKRATIPGGIGTGQIIKTKDITDIDPVTILLIEDEVPRRVEIISLPKDIQAELGYDAAKAAAYKKSQLDAQNAASVAAAKAKVIQDKADADALKKKIEADKKAAAAAKSVKPVQEDPNKWVVIPVGTK